MNSEPLPKKLSSGGKVKETIMLAVQLTPAEKEIQVRYQVI